MKKQLFAFILLLTIAGWHAAKAQCTWLPAGTGTVATSASNVDIAYDNSSSTPYVIYTDNTSLNTVVKKLSSGSWVQVGPALTTTITAYNKIKVSAAGTPYVIYQDPSAGKKAVVKTYNGSAWVAVGTGTISVDTAAYNDLAFDNSGTLYAAFSDKNSGKKPLVKKYSGGTWTNVGSAVSTGTAAYISLDFDAGNVPYVAFQDVGSVKPLVYNYNGSSWVSVGGSVSSTNGSWITLAFNRMTNEPYISYMDGSFNGYVKSFTAGSWQPVGSSFYGPYTTMDMAIDSAGTPYVTYYDITPYKASVMKYSGGSWSYAGNSGMSAGAPSSNAIAIAPRGLPYVACTSGSAYAYQLTAPTGSQPLTQNLALCSGAIASFTAATGATSYQWQINSNGTGVGPYGNLVSNAPYSGTSTATLSINTASVSSGFYRVVTNNGCINEIYYRGKLTVNPLPAVAATSFSICQGAVKTLTASGASTYTWSTGDISPTTTVSPTSNTMYSVTGTDANGCSATASATVMVTASKTFSGTVTSPAGAVNGNMILYKYKPFLSKWDSVAFAPFSSIYSFGITDSSDYVIKAVPATAGTQITYAPSVTSWQNAAVISHGCAASTSQSVVVQALSALSGSGPGSMSGHITEAQGYGHKTANIQTPGNPIPGVVVKGGKNPGAAIFAQTVTDANGLYAFTNVPDNNPGETYFILVDIPGLDTNLTYHKVLVPGNDNFTTLDFTVDSIYVNPVTTTSVNELNKADYLVQLFPNPARDVATIRYSLPAQAAVTIELLDISGRQVRMLQPLSTQQPGDYAPSLPLDNLGAGMYFVKLLIGRQAVTMKLSVTD